MFLNMDMKEGASGEVEINDVHAETMDMLLYYLYHEEVEDAKLVDTNLLFAAEKYNVPGLLKHRELKLDGAIGHFAEPL